MRTERHSCVKSGDKMGTRWSNRLSVKAKLVLTLLFAVIAQGCITYPNIAGRVHYFNALWSPDGKFIAIERSGDCFIVAADVQGEHSVWRGGDDLIVVDVEKGSRRCIARTHLKEHAWSSAENKILFAVDSGRGIQQYIADMDTGKKWRIRFEGEGDWLVWAPDGKHLMSKRSKEPRLYDFWGKEIRKVPPGRLSPNMKYVLTEEEVWTIDGKKILDIDRDDLYTIFDTGVRDERKYGPAQIVYKEREPKSYKKRGVYKPQWSPRSDMISYISRNCEIVLVKVSNGEKIIVDKKKKAEKSDVLGRGEYHWSPAGNMLAYSQPTGTETEESKAAPGRIRRRRKVFRDLYIYDVDKGARKKFGDRDFVHSGDNGREIAWGQNGKKIKAGSYVIDIESGKEERYDHMEGIIPPGVVIRRFDVYIYDIFTQYEQKRKRLEQFLIVSRIQG